MKAVIDTNILIDYLAGDERARTELRRYRHPRISRITWMEVMVGVSPDGEEEGVVRDFLGRFAVVEVSQVVAEAAIRLRREHRIRLPDAIILASAHTEECLLVTRNSRDFRPEWPDVRIPYA